MTRNKTTMLHFAAWLIWNEIPLGIRHLWRNKYTFYRNRGFDITTSAYMAERFLKQLYIYKLGQPVWEPTCPLWALS